MRQCQLQIAAMLRLALYFPAAEPIRNDRRKETKTRPANGSEGPTS